MRGRNSRLRTRPAYGWPCAAGAGTESSCCAASSRPPTVPRGGTTVDAGLTDRRSWATDPCKRLLAYVDCGCCDGIIVVQVSRESAPRNVAASDSKALPGPKVLRRASSARRALPEVARGSVLKAIPPAKLLARAVGGHCTCLLPLAGATLALAFECDL